MSFWLNEQKVLTHIRWISMSKRVGFLAGILFILGGLWVFKLFFPQRNMIKATLSKQQTLQQTIEILSSQLTRYEKLAALVGQKNVAGNAQPVEATRWVDAFDRIICLLESEHLTCKKVMMLANKQDFQVNTKTVEYVFTGRYAHVISFLEKIQHQFPSMNIIHLQIDRIENHAVSVTLRLYLLDEYE